MNYVYLAIFVIFTSLHLYASKKNDYLFRASTKGIILLSVMGFYLESVSEPMPYIIIALILSWIGDMFLIPRGTKWFVYGGISFMISHLFFIFAYASETDFSKINLAYLIILPVIYIVIVCILFSKLKLYLKKSLFYPMFFYLLLNGAMNCCAFFRFLSVQNPSTIVTFIGAILFFISDSTLFFVRFNKDSKLKTHFLVMLTYSLGEFLIILGFVL